MRAVGVAVIGGRDALAAEAEALERGLGAAVARAGERGQALEAEPPEGQRRDQRLGLAVRPRAPPAVAEPAPDGGTAVAPRELREAGHADRPVVGVDDQHVELLAAVAARRERGYIGRRLLDVRVRAPGEEAGHRRVAPELEQRGGVRGRRVAQCEAGAADAQRIRLVRNRDGGEPARGAHRGDGIHAPWRLCSTTCTAICPRWRPCWPTRAPPGPTAGSSAATTRSSAAGRPRRWRACASSSRPCGSAATASAGATIPVTLPTSRSSRARSPRSARRSGLTW